MSRSFVLGSQQVDLHPVEHQPGAVPAPSTSAAIAPTLVWALESALMDQADPRDRAAVVARIVEELHQALLWLHADDRSHPEPESLIRLLDAAQAHRAHMAEVVGAV